MGIAAKILSYLKPGTQTQVDEGELSTVVVTPKTLANYSGLGGGFRIIEWNAETNEPELLDSDEGDSVVFYKVTTSGSTEIGGFNNWFVDDFVVFDPNDDEYVPIISNKKREKKQTTIPDQGIVFDGNYTYNLDLTEANIDLCISTYGHSGEATIFINIKGDPSGLNTIINNFNFDLDNEDIDSLQNNTIMIHAIDGVVDIATNTVTIPKIAFSSQSLQSDNSYIDVTVSLGSYYQRSAFNVNQISIENFLSNGDDISNVSDITIDSVTNSSGQALTGGETILRVNLSYTTPSTGLATFNLRFTDIENAYGETSNIDTQTIQLNSASFVPSDLSSTTLYQSASVSYDGSNFTELSSPYTTPLDSGTFEIWFRYSITDGQGATQIIIGSRNLNNNNARFQLQFRSNGEIYLNSSDGTDSIQYRFSSIDVPDGASSGVMRVCMNSGTPTIYIDGTSYTVGSTVTLGTYQLRTENLYVGAGNNGGSAEFNFTGSREDLFIGSAVLSGQDLTNMNNFYGT